MNLPGLQLVRGSHQFIVHYKDGSLGVLENLSDSLRGRSLDDIVLVEMHPTSTGGLDMVIGGAKKRIVQLGLAPGLPFPVRIVLDYETAVETGRHLQGPFIEVAR